MKLLFFLLFIFLIILMPRSLPFDNSSSLHFTQPTFKLSKSFNQ